MKNWIISAGIILVVSSCSQRPGSIDLKSFVPPDSLGETMLVSVHDTGPVGSVSFISYTGPEKQNVQFVSYFSDGSVISERLRRKGSDRLEAEDGAPEFLITDSVITLVDYTTSKNCIGTNVTKAGP